MLLTLSGEPIVVIDGVEHPLPAGGFARLDPKAVRRVESPGAGAGGRAARLGADDGRLPEESGDDK